MITLITPTSSQPRFHKRALALKKAGFSPYVFFYKRAYYNINKFPDSINSEFLYELEDGKYLKRAFKFLKSIFKLRKHRNLSKHSIAYAFSIDCALVALLSGYEKIIYEIGDIRSTSFITRTLEKFIVSKSSLVIVTSKGFKEHLQKEYSLNDDHFLILENKIVHTPRTKKSNRKDTDLVIGIIGFLRYEKPLRYLSDFSKKHRISLSVYGDGPYKDLFTNNPYANFHGPFKNPDDLDAIYSAIDINYTVYDNESLNVRLALPNKLYESMAYQVPMIVASNTFLEKCVQKHSLGDSVGLDSFEVFEKDMLEALKGHLNLKESINKFQTIEYTDDSYQLLKNKINKNWNTNEATYTKS